MRKKKGNAMYRLFRLLYILTQKETAAYGKKKIKQSAPGLFWLFPPFRALFYVRHPLKALYIYGCLHMLRFAAVLLRRAFRE